MSYRLEDLYHFAVTDEVSEEEARFAAQQAVDRYMQEWMRDHPDYSLHGIFTAGCCAGVNIRKSIKQRVKQNGNTI